MKIRLSSRQSELAQFQAYAVGEALEKIGHDVEYLFRESLGDKNLTDPLWKMPEKGVFTEDFYLDLVHGRTDMVVHSWKDLPTEDKPDTLIAATLPRADQRDLLLFKKSSLSKKSLRLFSSSPRRAHNLGEFLPEVLPSKPDKISFESVRGNISTRVKKWLDDADIDGLIVAKAAIDRLTEGRRFQETAEFLKRVLAEQLWMVLPLGENPNAAAQGALAIEVASARKDLQAELKKINCERTFAAVQKERQILKEFGGGCHLALGMSVLQREFGQLEIVRGLTPDQARIYRRCFTAKRSIPAGIEKKRLNIQAQRKENSEVDLSGLNALYVAKAEAWVKPVPEHFLVWASGIETWKKLAARGVWVFGCNESLGESEAMNIEHFLKEKPVWGRLSHAKASPEGDKKPLNGYHVELSILDESVDPKAAYLWMSPLEFDLAIEKFPELKSAYHICGPGRTYEALLKRLGHGEKLFVELLTYK